MTMDTACFANDRQGQGDQQEKTDKKMVLVSAVALIDSDGRILIGQRPEGQKMAGYWEFPGGKIEQGETPESALIRELREELGIETSHSCLAPLTFASHEYDDFHLLMCLFLCRVWQGGVQSRIHQNLAWVYSKDLMKYDMLPADIPMVALLRDWLS